MSESLTIDFNNADEHNFDTDKIQVSGGNTQCKLDQVNAPFTEDFADDTDHTYNSDELEFAAGAAAQKDQRPTGYNIFDDYSDATDANWGVGTLTRVLAGATISNGELDCSGGTKKKCTINADNFALGDEIKIDFKFKPDFNGTPGENTWFFHQASTAYIQIYMSSTGQVICRIHNGTSYVVNRSFIKNDWVQNQQYRMVLFVKSGDSRLYLDGISQWTDTGTWTKPVNSTAVYIGSNSADTYNGHFKFDDLFIGTGVDYVIDSTYPSTINIETSDVLPEMEHTGDGTIKSFVSLSVTYTGSPRILLEVGRSGDKLYWNGSAWAVSDETYAQATDPTTFNTNCTSLAVDGENYGQFTIVFPDSNTQSSVSELTATMNVDVYPTTNPTIEPDASFRTDEIESLVVTYVATGSDAVNCVMKKGDTWYYWTGSAWASTAGNLYAESSTVADAMTNITTLVTASEEVKIKFFLHSHDGTTSPSVSGALFTYSYGGDTPDTIDRCLVWGYAKNNGESVNTTSFVVYLEKDHVNYKTNTIIRQERITITPDTSGYFKQKLVETENMKGSPRYIFEWATDDLEYRNIPNQARAFYGDLT
jgi:hypothetical protein